MERDTVYDLGEVPSALASAAEKAPAPAQEWGDPDATMPPPLRAAGEPTDPSIAPETKSANTAPAVSGGAAGLTAPSLSLFLPGVGHVLQSRVKPGLTIFGLTALCVLALMGAWSVMPRLWMAAGVMQLPNESAVWLLGGLSLLVIAFQLVSVLQCRMRIPQQTVIEVHPAAASTASGLIPGWGQMLNGNLLRTSLFLLGAWVTISAWVLASQPVQDLLVAYQLHLPASLAVLSSEPMRWALVALVWPLAMYDAGSSAALSRR